VNSYRRLQSRELSGISTVIHVDHDLDITSAPVLDASIRLAEADTDCRIVVSLERCSYCDANGLTVLIRAKKRNGSNFTVVVPDSERCRRVFEITGLSKSLSVFPNLERALETFSPTFSDADHWVRPAVDISLGTAV
jgi:anti-anti-sigma factor